jgi:N-acetylmuramoyl-L-alanine amidase
VRRVQNPDRIAINIQGAELDDAVLAAPIAGADPADGVMRGIRANRSGRRAQVVIDLESRADFRSFSLPAAGGRPDRIVVDVLRPGTSFAEDGMVATVSAPVPAAKPFTVIIDPGHGGPDPGATREGVAEKDVVLDIAREMGRLINALPGYRAELTRTGDYGLELWQRVEFARRQGGDLFLSVHCNTHPSVAVGGMEVYFLSLQRASDSRAQELADQENAAQLVDLAAGAECDAMVIDILLDLKRSQILKESSRLANQVLAAGQASGVVAGRAVKQAGFQVLKNLAMPSALVEVAYLSHPGDLAVLKDRLGRKDLAAVIVRGMVAWQKDQPALDQLASGQASPWTRDYQVRRGDSLWGLARRHGTTVTEISRHNDLHSGSISVGQNLRLPEVGQEP